MSGKPLMHGEPDAWKPARPVRREGWRDLALKGVVALHPYSTFGFEPAPFAASMAIGQAGAIRRRSHSWPAA